MRKRRKKEGKRLKRRPKKRLRMFLLVAERNSIKRKLILVSKLICLILRPRIMQERRTNNLSVTLCRIM